MLQQAQILPRRPQKHRHLVERDAARRFVEHTPDDLHRFSALARRGKETDIAGALPWSRAIGSEHEAPQVREIGIAGGWIFGRFDGRRGQRVESRQCGIVSVRHGCKHGGRSLDECRHERALGARVERHVEEHQWQRGPPHRAGLAGRACEPKQFGAIGDRCARELTFDSVQQVADVARAGIAHVEAGTIEAGEPQFVDGPRQRPGKARHPRDGSEVFQFAVSNGVEYRAGGGGLGPGLRAGDAPYAGEVHGGRPCSQFAEREPGDAEGGAALDRKTAREIVCGATRRADDHDFGWRRIRLKKPARPIEPRRGGRRRDDAQHRVLVRSPCRTQWGDSAHCR
jgi:hypothetical protein